MLKITTANYTFAHDLTNQLLEQFEQDCHLITDNEVKIALRATIKHMRQYVEQYNILIESIDAYKIVSWFAFELHKACSCELKDYIILRTTMILNEMLKVDTDQQYEHTEAFIIKIYQMALNDKQLSSVEDFDTLAIGQNGFYLAFKSPSMMYLSHDSTQTTIPVQGALH